VPTQQPDLVDLESLRRPREVELAPGVVLQQADTRRVLLLYGTPLMAWDDEDAETRRLCIALLAERELAPQEAIAEAFGVERTTVWRLRRAWREAGVRGVELKKRGPKGPRVAKGRCRRQIVALGRAGYSQRAVARRLGVGRAAVRGVFRAEGLGAYAERAQLFEGPAVEAPCGAVDGGTTAGATVAQAEPPAQGPPAAPCTAEEKKASGEAERAGEPEVAALEVGAAEGAPARDLERVLARAGLLEEAKPQFASGEAVPCAGVLLALALLSRTALFEVAEGVYGRLRPAFYGLKNLLRVLFVMALLRVKRAEGLASCPPQALGRVVGLDRLPEVKTLRRKFNEVAARGRATDFVAGMAQAWAAATQDAVGFLLVDGHVRVYSGTRPIPKGYAARRRLATRAITDYWVNDGEGMPLFVVAAPTNPHLTEVLPDVLAEAQAYVGDRPITVVFDRGGWKPKLFRQLRDAGYHLLTYRKGKYRPVPAAHFSPMAGQIDGRKLDYRLADGHIRLRGFGRMRRVAVERRDGEQTHVLTTREDLSALEVAYHMFGRWRQENFFKYMIQHFELDALVSYQTQPDDPERLVPNPAWRTLSKRRAKARRELNALEAELGRLDSPAATPAAKRPRPSREDLLAQIEKKRTQVARLLARLKATPRRVPLQQAAGEGGAVLLENERKRFTDVVKLTAYRVESELLALVAPHYRRHIEEGRAVVREMMQATGDLEATNHTLTVRLRPLSCPRHTAAMAAVCEELNQRQLHFPGTDLVLNFAVKDPACCT
jgi:transposase